jgi:hypothetical protein
MIRPTVKLGLPLLVVLATGCTTMGTGFGSTASGSNPVNFSWKSSDTVSGSMNATPWRLRRRLGLLGRRAGVHHALLRQGSGQSRYSGWQAHALHISARSSF